MNPYFHRGAISDPEYFFGRKKILDRIYSALNAPKPLSISIEGERRIGKSSLLNYLIHPQTKRQMLLKGNQFVFVLVNFIETQPMNAAEFIHTLHYYLRLELETNEDAKDSAVNIGKSGSTKEARRVKEKLIDHLMQLKKSGFHVVFVIDEADAAFKRTKLDYSVFDFMRSLADVSRYYSVSYIIASRKPLRNISKALDSSKFHNIFDVCNLGLLTDDEALNLIHTPSQRSGQHFLSTEIEYILKLAGRHPLFLQIVCYYLFEQKTQCSLVDFNALTEVSYAQTRPIMADWLDDATVKERQVFQEIAMDSPTKTFQNHGILKKLVEKGLIVEKENAPLFFCSLFARFFAESIDNIQNLENPIRVFISYSHQDKKYLNKNSLLGYLSGLEREGFEFWHDTKLKAGEFWDEEIKNAIERANIALILVSQPFLNSRYCMDNEVKNFLEKRTKGGLIVFPIILAPCDWKSYSWLATTQFEPRDGRTLERNFKDKGSRAEIYLQILQQLRELGSEIRDRRKV